MDKPHKVAPKENAELRRLQSQYVAAAKKALRAIISEGTSSEAAALAARRINEILGAQGSVEHRWRDNA
jgi:hypothetical protein